MVHMIYGFRVKERLFQFVLMIAFIALLCLFSTSRHWQIYFTFISHLPHKFYTDFSEKLLRACTCDFTISCVTLNMEKTDVPRAYLHKEHLFCVLTVHPTLKQKRRNTVMEREMQEKVLSLLESYEQMSRALQLMYYELQSIHRISPEDVIEVMSLQRKNEENTTELPHDIESIATCFRSVTAR